MAVMRTGFAEIKNRFNAADYLRRIDPERILDYYGAENRIEQKNGHDGTREIVHSCLLDKVERHHANGDQNPSAAMNADKATYACYGYWMGGIFEFVKKMEQKEDLHAIVDVLGHFLVDGAVADRSGFLAELEALFRARDARPADLSTPAYAEQAIARWTGTRHPYATAVRQITDTAYEALRLGYDPDTRRLVFPLYVDGRLLGWQQRAIPDRPGEWPGSVDQQPKYKNNPSFPKSTTLYNIDAARHSPMPVVVVESPMSVAYAVSRGLENPVVATFGASLPNGQLDLIRELGPVVLWFDADPAGWKAEVRACAALHRHQLVSVVVPEKNKDLADYPSLEEIQDKITGAKPAVLRMIDHKRGIR